MNKQKTAKMRRYVMAGTLRQDMKKVQSLVVIVISADAAGGTCENSEEPHYLFLSSSSLSSETSELSPESKREVGINLIYKILFGIAVPGNGNTLVSADMFFFSHRTGEEKRRRRRRRRKRRRRKRQREDKRWTGEINT